jgi:hypothetical protein
MLLTWVAIFVPLQIGHLIFAPELGKTYHGAICLGPPRARGIVSYRAADPCNVIRLTIATGWVRLMHRCKEPLTFAVNRQ